LKPPGFHTHLSKKRTADVYHTTGFSRDQITDLCELVQQAAEDEGTRFWPPILGLFKSVVVALTYLRRNRVQDRRRLAMPTRCVEALKLHHLRQAGERKATGKQRKEHGLVFASLVGTAMDSHNVRRSFRAVLATAGLEADDWTPREMRHSFVSLLSDSGVALEHTSRLVGHSGTAVTEAVKFGRC
jgi:integrase